MERQLFILREDHQHRTRHEFINSLTRSPANFNFSGVLRPLADRTALWKWVLKVQMESLLHNHHIVHLTFTLKWQIEAKNCSVCSKEPPSHSPEYLTLIKTLIQTNPLSHPTVSLPLSPPPSLKQWLFIPMCSWIRSCERLKSSRRQFSTSARPLSLDTHSH